MQINRAAKKTLLMFFGIIFGLVLVESCLNAVDFIYSSWFHKSNQEFFKYDAGACRIICLGDSWTLGMGAVAQQDYPAQLQVILNESQMGCKFKVYNLGYPNFTSAMAIKKFKEICPRLKPHIVIAMIGRSDQWSSENANAKSKVFQITKQRLLDTKIGKLIKISIYNLHYNGFKKQTIDSLNNEKAMRDAMVWIKLGNEHRSNRTFVAAEACYNNALEIAPDLMFAFIEKSRCYKIQGQYEKAASVLTEAFISDISNKEIAQELIDIFIRWNEPQKTVDFYYQIFQKKPDSDLLKSKLVNAYIILADTLFTNKQYDKTIEIYNKALSLDPENKRLYISIAYNQSMLYSKGKLGYQHPKHIQTAKINSTNSIEKSLTVNLNLLARFCKKQGITLILSGYPLEMLKPIQEVAAENKIPLVDHRQSFQGAERSFFAKDGHCNSLGYKLVAENIAEQIYLIINNPVFYNKQKEKQ
ncbi:MAG: hypothetical protein V1747_10575 [Candidatus Omnitrophota bacterium]